MGLNNREEHVFVVRVWSERAGLAPQWRAVVEDVSTGHRLASTDLREVDDFIRLRIGAGDPSRG
jgi:hypothetical protein